MEKLVGEVSVLSWQVPAATLAVLFSWVVAMPP